MVEIQYFEFFFVVWSANLFSFIAHFVYLCAEIQF